MIVKMIRDIQCTKQVNEKSIIPVISEDTVRFVVWALGLQDTYSVQVAMYSRELLLVSLGKF